MRWSSLAIRSAIEFHSCPVCGCVIFWRAQKTEEDGLRRIAVNLRLAEPADIPIDHFDGFDTFEDLPRDGRCVRDYWFLLNSMTEYCRRES